MGNGTTSSVLTSCKLYLLTRPNAESIRIVGSDFLNNGLNNIADHIDGIWIGEEAAVVESVSLTSVTANGNVGSGLNIPVTGPVKLSAVTSQNNGIPDMLP
jgi:hypothetical protein